MFVDWMGNCTFRKQRGCRPTGLLLPTAKANGFSSVSDMLHLKEIRKAEKDEGASSMKRKASNEVRSISVSGCVYVLKALGTSILL